MIAFVPEPLAALQARYAAALVPLFDHADPTAFLDDRRPGQHRTHVFDTDLGLRLIVSRERNHVGAIGIHLSASIEPGTAYERLILGAPRKDAAAAGAAVEAFKVLAIDAWRVIARQQEPGPRDQISYVGLSPGKGVPHWWISTELLSRVM